MDIMIRKLTVGDNRFLIRLIDKLITEFKQSWLKEVVKDNAGSQQVDNEVDEETERANNSNIFYTVINLLLQHYSNELTEWFASLLNLSVEEYEQLDFGTDAVVIEQVLNDESFKFFFQKAFALYNLRKTLGNFTNIVKSN